MKKLNFVTLAVTLLVLSGCATVLQDYDKSGGSGQLDQEMGGGGDAKPDESADQSAFESETPKQSSGSLEKRFEDGVNNGRERQMLNAGSELLARSPDNIKVLNGFGTYYIKAKMPDAAKIYFERVLEKDKDNADANNGLGVIEMMNGDEFAAQEYFKNALRKNSRHVGANANLGAIYLKYLDYDKALRLLENAYRRDRGNAAIANNYAIALRGTGKIDNALKVYQSIDTRKQQVPVLLNQAILWTEFKKDPKAAKDLLNKIRFITTDPSILRKVNALTNKLNQ